MKTPLPNNEAQRIELLQCQILDTPAEATFDDLTHLAFYQYKQASKVRKQFFKRVAGGFGLASVILVLISIVSYYSIAGQIETNRRLAQTQEILKEMEDLLSQVKDAETGQSGYLLTGKESYLKPYQEAITNIAREIKHLKQLTIDKPSQQQRIKTLEPAIAAKLDILKQTIALRRNRGFDAALQLFLTDKGNNLMNQIRSVVRQMESEENALLKQQMAATKISTRNMLITLAIATFSILLILVAVYYLIYQEFTERKQVEVSLKQERNFIFAVLDTTSALVVVLDLQGRIVRFNSICEQITGYSFDEVKGRYFWNLFLIPEEVEPVKAIFEQSISGKLTQECETYIVNRDGSRRLIAWSNTRLFDSRGEVEYIISTGTDITERKQLEAELRQALEQEKELHELKSRFVSIASHEFRTPLATILGSSELLKYYSHTWSEEKKLFYLHRIQATVQHMNQMLEEVLLLGKAEAGKLQCQPQPLDLIPFCRSLIEELQLLPENQHYIQFSQHGQCGMVQLDEKLLRHILGNLLSNAIKYSPPDSTVHFTVTDEQKAVVFQIHDQGIGIPQEDQKHLFESFYRATNVGSTPGTGLGLAIVKKAVDLHQGKITFNSTIGVGTTFTVTLPLGKP